MANYKKTDKSQGLFLSVNLEEQILPGTFEWTGVPSARERKEVGYTTPHMRLVLESIHRHPGGWWTYKATDENLILDARLKQPPMNRMSCGSQPANIRLINRRESFPIYSAIITILFS
jgi:hypothetical protein